MERRKKAKKGVGKGNAASIKGAKVARKYYGGESDSGLAKGEHPKEPATGYGVKRSGSESFAPFAQKSFKVSVAGKERTYTIHSGYGYFIPSFRKAENLMQVSQYVEGGLPSKEIETIVRYLNFKVPEIAKAAAVSPSTVSRWEPETSIGLPGSSQFFKIDEVIRKGVNLFGGEEEFKNWLNSPNIALGNVVPAKLITSFIGVELVDEALDALHYGNVM